MSSLQLPKGAGFGPSLSSNKFHNQADSLNSLSDGRSFRGLKYEVSRRQSSKRHHESSRRHHDDLESEVESGEVRENYDEMNLIFGPSQQPQNHHVLNSKSRGEKFPVSGDPTRLESMNSDDVGAEQNQRYAVYKEPVLTVAALNEMFKS